MHNSRHARKFPVYLTDRVQYILEQSIQENTNDSYNSSWNKYLEFCYQFNEPPLPLNEITLAYFMAYRLNTVKASTTMSSYYGVKHVAALHGHPFDDSHAAQLQRIKRSLRRVFGAKTPDLRRPITFEMLAKAYKYFNFKNYDEIVYYTMMVCATTGLMRSSEIFAKNKRVKPREMTRASIKALWCYNLKVHRDKQTGDIKFYRVTIRATKTEKGHQDVDIVWSKGKYPVSPVDLLTQL